MNLSETRNKRRNNVINNKNSIVSSISFLEKSVSKRRRENSVEATNFTMSISAISITKQYLTAVKILLASQKSIALI